MKSAFRLTEPTVIVGLPDSFFVQPARFMSEPVSGNSGSQKRRVEQWKQSTPASTSGARKRSSSAGDCASRAAKSCCFHCEKRSRMGKSSPTASRTARVTSAAKLVRFSSDAAIAVVALVGAFPEELVDDVAVRAVQLDAVEAELLGVARAFGEARDDVGDLAVGHRLGDLLAGLRQARRSHALGVRIGAGARMTHDALVPELRHDVAAGRLHLFEDLRPACERLPRRRRPGTLTSLEADLCSGEVPSVRIRPDAALGAGAVIGRDVSFGIWSGDFERVMGAMTMRLGSERPLSRKGWKSTSVSDMDDLEFE